MTPMLTVQEHDLIGSEQDWSDEQPGLVRVSDATFRAIRQLAFSPLVSEGLLAFGVQKGREYVRISHYAGLFPLPDGTQVEVLPKIGTSDEARATLLAMLRHLRDGSFRTLPAAQTSALRLPLWEVFVGAFLTELEGLLAQGMQRAYVSVESNERFWRGKFQATRQQRENAWHAEQLAVRYDHLTANVPPNRILKTTLCYLQARTRTRTNQQRLTHCLSALADVPASESLPEDLTAIRRASRLFARYEPALRWAEALLGGKAFGVSTGPVPELSLLFPMERVFEDYVAHGIRTFWPNTDVVTVQESSAHLVDEHAGTPKFRLRPDILIRQANRTIVLDTKWKRIDGSQPGRGSYGIEQADLYQLYAYGKKYAADDLFLVYPANETFREPLAVFGYDASTRLHVVPFDPVKPLRSEVEKLVSYALTG